MPQCKRAFLSRAEGYARIEQNTARLDILNTVAIDNKSSYIAILKLIIGAWCSLMSDALTFKFPTGWLEPSLHCSYLKLMLRRNGYLSSEIAHHFHRPSGLYSYLEIHNIIQNLNFSIASDAAVDFGLHTSLAAQGLFGQAAAASINLEQAMSVMATYLPTRNNIFIYSWAVTAKGGEFRIRPRFDLYEDLETTTLMTLINLVHVSTFLCGEDVIPEMGLSVPWDIEKLPSFHKIKRIKVEQLSYTDEFLLTIPNEILQRENLFADSRQFRLACMGCEEELNILRGRFTERVRSIIAEASRSAQSDYGPVWRSLQKVSEQLAISPRTLNRKLQQENTSFSQILDETRSELACWYLKNSDLSIAEISSVLGYADDTNFARTFKRWKHITPISYRQQRGAFN